jgi:hypothetical protein
LIYLRFFFKTLLEAGEFWGLFMAKKEYSTYQTEVIGRYYGNIDNIMLQKLGELVSELYLADSSSKRDKLWQRVNSALINLGIKSGLVRHIMEEKDVEVLAKNLQDWLAVKNKK